MRAVAVSAFRCGGVGFAAVECEVSAGAFQTFGWEMAHRRGVIKFLTSVALCHAGLFMMRGLDFDS